MKKLTGKMKGMAKSPSKGKKKKDPLAHSSHHDSHGEGDQAGIHGFGPNFAGGKDSGIEGECGGAMGDNCSDED